MTLLAVFLDFGMLPVDLEVGDVMLERSPLREIGRRVALGTGHIEELFVELLLMHTRVAGDAEITIRIRELEDLVTVSHVTLLAVRRLVLARQGEAGLVMEGAIGLNLTLQAHNLPAVGRVTLFAGHAFELLMKRSRMRRHVTGCAALLRKIRESVTPQVPIFPQHLVPLLPFEGLRRSGRSMAFKTLVFLVFPCDREDGLGIMIKAEGVLPLDIVVAGIAFQKRALLDAHFLAITMVIRMTGVAVLLQTCPLKRAWTFGQHRWALLVTVLAGDPIVFATQRKACHAMVEFLLRLQG